MTGKFCNQASSALVGGDNAINTGGTSSVRIESSHIINLRDLDVKHVKDFTFVHGGYAKATLFFYCMNNLNYSNVSVSIITLIMVNIFFFLLFSIYPNVKI